MPEETKDPIRNIGPDATAGFESAPNFAASNPTERAGSENLASVADLESDSDEIDDDLEEETSSGDGVEEDYDDEDLLDEEDDAEEVGG